MGCTTYQFVKSMLDDKNFCIQLLQTDKQFFSNLPPISDYYYNRLRHLALKKLLQG